MKLERGSLQEEPVIEDPGGTSRTRQGVQRSNWAGEKLNLEKMDQNSVKEDMTRGS